MSEVRDSNLLSPRARGESATLANLPIQTERDEQRREFVQSYFKSSVELQALPQDASKRSYYRISHNSDSYILMDCPVDYADITEFMNMTYYLCDINLSAPKIFHHDKAQGFLLLEDLGNNRVFDELTRSPQSSASLYQNVIRTLVALQKNEPPKFIGEYPLSKMIDEALLFVDWYLLVINGTKLSDELRQEFISIWTSILPYADIFPKVTVLKDFHVENLMYLPERSAEAQIGLLDYQDAYIGSPVYDLVSLLEDARIQVDKSLANKMINYYLDLNSNMPRKDLLAAYNIIGAQKNMRILGVFARIASVSKKSKYLQFVPRVLGYLENDLNHPLLSPLKLWYDRVMPRRIGK